jgi:hypothetical protein
MKPKRIHVPDQSLMRVQDAIADTINKWPDFLYSAQLIGPFNLVTGDNIINHGLDTVLQGWLVVRRSTGAVLYDKQTTNRVPNKTLIVNSSTNVTISLIVF